MKFAKKLLAALILLVYLAGCEAIDELTIFTMDYYIETTISSAAGVNLPFNLYTPAISTNSSSEFELKDTRKDLIEEIKLQSLQLEVSLPENGDLSFLQSIEIYANGDGLEEKLIAWNNSVNTSEKTVALETTTDDLQQYLKLDVISLRIHTTVKKILLTDYIIQIHTEFLVNAKILGI